MSNCTGFDKNSVSSYIPSCLLVPFECFGEAFDPTANLEKSMTQLNRAHSAISRLPFHSIRNISCPEDLSEKRLVYTGQMPISSIVGLSTHENVRGYLVASEGKKRRSRTQVHYAIRETLREKSSDFSVLNGGVVIVAKKSEIDEKSRRLQLTDASIINGSQTQGEIEDYIKNGGDGDAIHIKFELIVTSDEDLVADISIARNFQNDVELLSIAGRKGELNDLEKALQKTHPELRLRMSESQKPSEDNNLIATEKLLQVLAALLPGELWWKGTEVVKTYTYSAKATCLKDFRTLYDNYHAEEPNPKMAAAYKYYLDMAGAAWDLYEKWKTHKGFKGTGLRSIQRDGAAEIVDVPDGIIFPIIAALSNFVIKPKKTWTFAQPEELEDSALIASAKLAYMEIAKSKPEIMGKHRGCYSGLERETSIYKRLLKS